ncbi:MAG: protein kinase domain-containing protein, partial [Terriglobales bacterium]
MAVQREIGHFEILERLGAGGMGEVYKARDQRLNRMVAVKVLPEGASVAARERFQREALAIAALNHPHICTLFEAGEHDGQPYLVMELLEGETLHARLGRGPLAPAEVIQWGAEVADALQAAHAKGILHRDLKPGNIFITRRGAAKVLDFGLAQFAQAVASEAAADAPTITAAAGPLTSPGSTLGTYAYMSPEQARAQPTDARSDLFSLGVVLYEMAAGRPPFQGQTSADLTAAILLSAPPPPSSVHEAVPARLDDIIGQCLEKDPEQRFQSAADLRISLRRLAGASTASPSPSASGVAAAPPASVPPTAIAPPAARRPWLWPAIAVVIVAAAATGWWYWSQRPAPPSHLQFRQLTFSGHVIDAVLSPDGKFLAHVDASPQGSSLHLLSIASGSDVEIMPPAPGCCQSPSFSPDGGQVYFLDNLQLKAVPVLGGAVRTIAAPACSGAGFSPDGSEIAYITSQAPASSVVIAHADGSQPHTLNTAPTGAGYMSQCWISSFNQPSHAPAWSPDGNWIAVALGPVSGDSHVALVDAHNGKMHTLGPGIDQFSAADLSWLPGQRGLVFTAQTSSTQPSQAYEMSYPGGRLLQLTNDLQGYAAVSLAASGVIAMIHAAPQASLWVQARPGGAFQQLPGGGADQEGNQGGVTWTPQGGLVAFRTLGAQSQLWAENADGSNAHVLSAALPDQPYDLNVAPNGQMIFGSGGDSNTIWRINAGGSGLMQLITAPAGAQATGPALALGGREVLYLQIGADGSQTFWMVPLAGGTPRQVWNGFAFA